MQHQKVVDDRIAERYPNNASPGLNRAESKVRTTRCEEEAAAARQTQHESLLYRQRIHWDQFGSSSIAFVPPGPPHELTNFASVEGEEGEESEYEVLDT